MRPRMRRRMMSSTRNSPRSTTTRTTRSLLKAGNDHDPHAKEHPSCVSMAEGHFSLIRGMHHSHSLGMKTKFGRIRRMPTKHCYYVTLGVYGNAEESKLNA